jgi:hypothetical protein
MVKSYSVYMIYVDDVVRYVVIRSNLTKYEARVLEEKLLVKFRGQLMAGDLTYSERAQRAANSFWQKPDAVEEKRQSQRIGMKRAMKDPKKRRNILCGLKAGRMSDVHIKLWQDPAYRQAVIDARAKSKYSRWNPRP